MHYFSENKGKREALHYAVKNLIDDDVEFVVTIDSDTVLEGDALIRVVEPLKSPRIGAATGNVLLLNESQNLLTRMIGTYYWVGLNIYKQAQSVIRSVVCCSGCLAAYRAPLLREIIDEFASQRFLGERCTHSEDRHLTNLVLREGYDVVYAVRSETDGENWFKRESARVFYWLFGRLTALDLPQAGGDFRYMSRRVVDALLAMPERHRFLRGMTSWVGYEQSMVEYERQPRAAGASKYTLRKMLRFSLDAIASFSHNLGPHWPGMIAALLWLAGSMAARRSLSTICCSSLRSMVISRSEKITPLIFPSASTSWLPAARMVRPLPSRIA